MPLHVITRGVDRVSCMERSFYCFPRTTNPLLMRSGFLGDIFDFVELSGLRMSESRGGMAGEGRRERRFYLLDQTYWCLGLGRELHT